MKKIVVILVVLALAITSCDSIPRDDYAKITKEPDQSTQITIMPTNTSITYDLKSNPLGSDNNSIKHPINELGLEDVKNLEEPIKISLDASGNLVGVPEDVSPDIETIRGFYDAVADKFSGASIFFSQDKGGSGQWILYAVSPNGGLYASTVSYAGGPDQFSDYPITYEFDGTKWNVTGDYVEVKSPGNISVIWINGFPQFIGDKVSLPSGDTYYQEGFDYTKYADQDPWQKVEGIDVLFATPAPETVTLDTLSDIHMDLTQDQIISLEGTLKNSVGIWTENIKFDTRDNTWGIKFTSSGELLDFQNDPLIVPVSEIENIQVLVATKGYYLDSLGHAQEVVIPLAAQMPDGKKYRYGGSGYFEEWGNEDDISVEIEKNSAYYLTKGGHILAQMMTNDDISKNNFDTFKPDFDYSKYPHLYMVQWIRKYNLLNQNKIQVFMATGNGLQFIIPYQMTTTP